MVMACCTRCYEKYIDKDGNLSEKGLDQVFGESKYKIIKDDSQKVVKIGFMKINLCTCICHREDCMVIH